MHIQIYSTEKIVYLNHIPARIWEGITDSGIKVHAYIPRIAIDEKESNTEEFEKELQEHRKPSIEIQAIPLSLIL